MEVYTNYLLNQLHRLKRRETGNREKIHRKYTDTSVRMPQLTKQKDTIYKDRLH